MRFLSGMAVSCLMLVSLGLSACGQKGPLVLASEQSKNSNKASYLLHSKKKNKQLSNKLGATAAPNMNASTPVATE